MRTRDGGLSRGTEGSDLGLEEGGAFVEIGGEGIGEVGGFDVFGALFPGEVFVSALSGVVRGEGLEVGEEQGAVAGVLAEIVEQGEAGEFFVERGGHGFGI